MRRQRPDQWLEPATRKIKQSEPPMHLMSLCHNCIFIKNYPSRSSDSFVNRVSGTTNWPYLNSLTLRTPEGESLALRNSLASSSTGLRQERSPKPLPKTLTRRSRRSRWERPTFPNQKSKLSRNFSVIRAPSITSSVEWRIFLFSLHLLRSVITLCTGRVYKKSFVKDIPQKQRPAVTLHPRPRSAAIQLLSKFVDFSSANAPIHRSVYSHP